MMVKAWLALLIGLVLAAPMWARPAYCPQPVQVAFYDLGVLFDPATGQGIDKDVIDELARRTGCEFESTFQSRVRIWTMLASGALDMSVSGIPTPERREFAIFVPYFWVRNELVMVDDGRPAITPAEFLADRGQLLGVVKSYKHGAGWDEWIEAMRRQRRVEEAPDSATLFARLDARRVQAIPALPLITLDMARRYPTHRRLTRLQWFTDQPKVEHGLILSKQRLAPELAAAFTTAVEKMRRDGTILRIFSRYMSEKDARDMMAP